MARIYTCTMNMAIDLFVETPKLVPNVVNRSSADEIQANGKGVNVSLILKKLGFDSTALGFSGGFTGNYIADFLRKHQISTDLIEVEGMTRINVFAKVKEPPTEYKLVNQGPAITPAEVTALLAKIAKMMPGDYLCLSGSLPQGVTKEILVKISQLCATRKVKLILDTSTDNVRDCLVNKPFLLKPNEQELAVWFGKQNLDLNECIACCRQLVLEGATQVLLSLGKNGGVFVDHTGYLIGNAPKGKVVNTACAGDTMLATFLGEKLQGASTEQAFKQSLAAGSSTAFSRGLTDFSDVAQLASQIKVTKEEFKNG